MPFILVPNEETNYYATLALSRPLMLHWAGGTSYRYQEAMFLLNSHCLFCRVPFIIIILTMYCNSSINVFTTKIYMSFPHTILSPKFLIFFISYSKNRSDSSRHVVLVIEIHQSLSLFIFKKSQLLIESMSRCFTPTVTHWEFI